MATFYMGVAKDRLDGVGGAALKTREHKMICKFCNTETNNPKFCSRSCAAKYNNSKHPKRIAKKYFCVICGKQCRSRRMFCASCINESRIENKTKKFLATGNANSFGYPQIRQHARSVYLKNNPDPRCEICGYDAHIEVHHKKSIEEFSSASLVSEINSLQNLVGLCPNHHWEADNGIICFSS